MSGKRGSNSRPSAWEADALPTELLPQVVVVVGLDDAKVITFSGIAKVATAFFTRGATALSFKIVLHLGEYCYFIADIGASMFSDFMISPYQV